MIQMLASRNWWVFLLRGVIALIFGLLAFLVPTITLASLILVFAAYAFVEGIFAVGAGLGAPGGTRWWIVIGGILAILIGILTFLNPGATALVLVIYIGALWIVRGIAEVVTAITLRKMIEGEWLYILIGVVSVLVGLYLIVFPGDGAIALLWLIGFYAIFAGIMYLAMAFRLRSIGSPGASPAYAFPKGPQGALSRCRGRLCGCAGQRLWCTTTRDTGDQGYLGVRGSSWSAATIAARPSGSARKATSRTSAQPGAAFAIMRAGQALYIARASAAAAASSRSLGLVLTGSLRSSAGRAGQEEDNGGVRARLRAASPSRPTTLGGTWCPTIVVRSSRSSPWSWGVASPTFRAIGLPPVLVPRHVRTP